MKLQRNLIEIILFGGEKNLEKTRTLKVAFLAMLILTLTFIQFAVAQEQTGNMQTFFESEWPGIEIRVNATREALPEENMTIILLVKSKADGIYIKYFDLTVSGFIEGQNKTQLGSIYQDAFSLNYNETKKYNHTFPILVDPQIWGTTYGELSFQYSIGGFSYTLSSLGFTMTHVRNIHLENLEEQFQSLSENFTELQQNYTRLEGNYTELKGKYDDLSKSVVELDNTRNIMIILAITTVVFLATTIYLIMRKPRQSW